MPRVTSTCSSPNRHILWMIQWFGGRRQVIRMKLEINMRAQQAVAVNSNNLPSEFQKFANHLLEMRNSS